MTIYDYYNRAVDRTDISLAYESVEQDAISIEHFVSKINYLSMSHEGVKEKFKEIVKRFVEFLKKIGRFFKNIFDKIFRRNKANVESAIKNFQNPSRLVFKNVKNESDYNKLDDKDKTEFKKYIVSLKCFHWFAFGPSAEDIKNVSEIIGRLNGILENIKSGKNETVDDIYKRSKNDLTSFMSVFNELRDYISGDNVNKEILVNTASGTDDSMRALSGIVSNSYGSSDKKSINLFDFYTSIINGKLSTLKSSVAQKTLNEFSELPKKIDSISFAVTKLDNYDKLKEVINTFSRYISCIVTIISRIAADVSFFVSKTRNIIKVHDYMGDLTKNEIDLLDRGIKGFREGNREFLQNKIIVLLAADRTGKHYSSALKYLKKNGISEDVIYEEHDGKELSDEPTNDNYAKLWTGLKTNFSKERVMMRIKVGRKLYPSEM